MKLDKSCPLFFATRVDSKLKEALVFAKPGEKKYFDGSSEEFLRIVEIAEEKWIGKVIKGGTAVTEVDDIQRNIISILRRIAPNARVPASYLKIFVLQNAAVVEPGIIDDEEPSDDVDPAAGAYITY